MTAPTVAPPVDDLMDAARKLARAAGEVPSRNALKAGLRVGSDKAAAVRERLLAERAQRREDRQRGWKRMASRRPQARQNRRSLARPALGLPVPTSPGTPPLPPMVLPQPSPVARPVEPTPAPAVQGGPEEPSRKVATWPLQLIALPAYVAIWAGWVALGKLTGFGKVNLLPGFGNGWVVDTAITLPIGAEAYAAYAFYVLFHPHAPTRARKFAAWSAAAALAIGMGGQVAYHLMAAFGMTAAPWQITALVSCLPVAVLGAAVALVHLVRAGGETR